MDRYLELSLEVMAAICWAFSGFFWLQAGPLSFLPADQSAAVWSNMHAATAAVLAAVFQGWLAVRRAYYAWKAQRLNDAANRVNMIADNVDKAN